MLAENTVCGSHDVCKQLVSSESANLVCGKLRVRVCDDKPARTGFNTLCLHKAKQCKAVAARCQHQAVLRHHQYLLSILCLLRLKTHHHTLQPGDSLFSLQARPEQLCMCCADPPGSASACYRLKSSISEAGGLEHRCTEPAVHVHFL